MVRAPAAVRPGGVEVRLGEERGQADQAQSEGLRSNRHAEAEAADALLPLKKKLRALSYGTGGQDPRHLFGQYDRDNSGELCATTIHTIIAVISTSASQRPLSLWQI